MNLATILIPPSLDAKQALRLRRFGLGVLGYALAVAMMAVVWAFDAVPASTALSAAAMFTAINLALYAAIRSGFNLRAADPSLTSLQIAAAIAILMYFVYHMEHGRSTALFGCFVIFLFAIFRLNAREITGLTLYTLAAHALVINLLLRFRPQVIVDVPGEWMSWLGLAVFLPSFILIGGQIEKLRRRLRESEARFRGLTEMSSDFYWESDAEHRLTQRASADKKVSSVSVFRQGTQIGERRWEIPYLTPDEAGWRAHRAGLDAHRPFRDFELSRLGADGTERHISISGDPIFDATGAFTGYRGVGTDVTDRKRADSALRESGEQMRLFADNVPAMTAYWDEHLRLRFASKVFTAFYGLAAEDIIGKHVREIFGDEVYRSIESHLRRMLEGHPVTYQGTREGLDGGLHHLEFKLLPHIGEHGKVIGCFAVTIDITEHKLAEERLQRVAHHDSLTGLPNRMLFDDRLHQAVARARRDGRQFALLYLDLDRFKPVNDALGHATGDELLQAVATRLRREVRESDTVARIGGDEFAVILPEVAGREEAEAVARKIVAALALPFDLGGGRQRIEIGISVGVAAYPADAGDAEALVKAADAAMYRAKPAAGSSGAIAAAQPSMSG